MTTPSASRRSKTTATSRDLDAKTRRDVHAVVPSAPPFISGASSDANATIPLAVPVAVPIALEANSNSRRRGGEVIRVDDATWGAAFLGAAAAVACVSSVAAVSWTSLVAVGALGGVSLARVAIRPATSAAPESSTRSAGRSVVRVFRASRSVVATIVKVANNAEGAIVAAREHDSPIRGIELVAFVLVSPD